MALPVLLKTNTSNGEAMKLSGRILLLLSLVLSPVVMADWVGMKAPAFSLPDQSGKVRTLAEFKGKWKPGVSVTNLRTSAKPGSSCLVSVWIRSSRTNALLMN